MLEQELRLQVSLLRHCSAQGAEAGHSRGDYEEAKMDHEEPKPIELNINHVTHRVVVDPSMRCCGSSATISA
jgi:hypothetical protein